MVYDKFHVIHNVVEACDRVRKVESRSNAGKREQLERMRWMWLKNRVNWTEKETQKWESMALERCVTGVAYKMRLVLQGICVMGGCRGSQETVPALVSLGGRNAGANRRTLRADSPSGPDSRGSLEWDPIPLDSRVDNRLHGGT